ncbi:30S ribosomal protein S19e [Halorutilales archaeon Cl-col2-1]
MVTLYDVPGDKMVSRVAEELKDVDEVEPPEWAEFAKTGEHKELPPEESDWWYTRTASIIRKVYTEGPIGVSRLSKEYGGSKNNGSAPAHHERGSRNIIRTALQQLEDAGYVETVEAEGRRVSGEGRSFLDGVAEDVASEIPELEQYQ